MVPKGDMEVTIPAVVEDDLPLGVLGQAGVAFPAHIGHMERYLTGSRKVGVSLVVRLRETRVGDFVEPFPPTFYMSSYFGHAVG